jgi:hypothetical protein
LPLTPFDIGKLKIAAHVREELERAGLVSEAIRCKSGDLETRPGYARVIVTIAGITRHIELSREEIEGCHAIVAGEVWYKIARLVGQFARDSA